MKRIIPALCVILVLSTACSTEKTDVPALPDESPSSAQSSDLEILEPAEVEVTISLADFIRPVPNSIPPENYDPDWENKSHDPDLWEKKFYEGLAVEEDGSQYGYVNYAGDLQIPMFFSHHPVTSFINYGYYLGYRDFHEGMAGAYLDTGNRESDSFGYINPQGQWAIEPSFLDGNFFQNGVAAVRTSDEVIRYINTSGTIIADYIAPRYMIDASVSVLESGLYPIQEPVTQLYGFMNASGEAVIQPAYLSVDWYSEGLAAVCSAEGRWGYLDMEGNWAVQPTYYWARPFSEGVAAVWTEEDYQTALNDAPTYYSGKNEEWDQSDRDIRWAGTFSYIDTRGNIVLQSANYEPKWQGAATPAPGVIDASNGMIVIFSRSQITTAPHLIDQIYNTKGEPLDILRDCSEQLLPIEQYYVGTWWNRNSDIFSDFSIDEDSSRSILMLYEDRTAMIYSSSLLNRWTTFEGYAGDVPDIEPLYVGYWACSETYPDGIILQDMFTDEIRAIGTHYIAIPGKEKASYPWGLYR